MSDLIAMAKYASVWTLTDITVMRLISEKRDESPFQISDRVLARAVDVSAPRFSNFFNCRHGSPSLREFIALCQVFNLNPTLTLEQALKRAGKAENKRVEQRSWIRLRLIRKISISLLYTIRMRRWKGRLHEIEIQREKAGMRHPDIADLLREATMLKVKVEERALAPDLCGFYWDENHTIMLNECLPDWQYRCTLCHELVHAKHHDSGCGLACTKGERSLVFSCRCTG